MEEWDFSMRKVFLHAFIALAALLYITACHKNAVINTSPIQTPEISQHTQEQAPQDITPQEIYSQDLMYYAQKYDPTSPLLTTDEQNAYYTDFQKKYFRVWIDTINTASQNISDIRKNQPLIKRDADLYGYHSTEIAKYTQNPGIAHNKLPRDTLYVYNLAKQENIDRGLNKEKCKKGIMTSYSHIRAMPTLHPYFLDFSLPGEGYPFDYWQLSTIPIGTPIMVYFVGENWALINSHICSGWVQRDHIAYIDETTINEIMTHSQIAITNDKIPLYNSNNSYVGQADIGTVFSYTTENDRYFEAIGIHRNTKGYAETITLNIPKDHAQKMPIPATTENIATLCQKMMGQTYGWGGLYFERDCSQTLLDLFIGFGILLPRNGKNQAYNFGTFLDLSEIATDTERKAEIVDKATPFFTLVRTPGHIMLYIGEENGEPMVFHTIWGLRTKDSEGNTGRHILGKTLITTLDPGKDLPEIDPEMTLIKRLEGITFIKTGE